MLINATQQEELRVALVDGQRLYDLDIENVSNIQKKANIYKGTITRIEPSLEACFVDYGSDRHGFLSFKEVAKSYYLESAKGISRPSIKDALEVGMELIIQVEKEERGNKGAALTTFISLAGRYLVLMPNSPKAGGVSRRIEGSDRVAIREAMSNLTYPDDMGVIVRTAGLGRTAEELQWDLDYLITLWNAITEAAKSPAPLLIYQESNIIIRALRDYYRSDIGEILIDNAEVYNEAEQFINQIMPQIRSKIKLYDDNIPLFTRYQIESQIQTAYQREVKLPSGGALVIDFTEALVSIDINSGKATRGADIEETALNTNLEAAEEIARQLKLRDLGGLIVIDFIDMINSEHQRMVEKTFHEALSMDRARIQTGHISRFGLLEMSRQRLRPSLDETTHINCPRCSGQGTIRNIKSLSLEILRLIEEEALKERTGEIIAQLPIDVSIYMLNEKREDVSDIEKRLNVRIVLIPNQELETPHFTLTRLRSDQAQTLNKESTEFVQPTELTDKELVEKALNKPKSQINSPVVSNIIQTAPPPVVENKVVVESLLVSGIKKFFSSIFSSNDAASEEKEKSTKKKEFQKNRQRPNNRRRTNNKRVTTRSNAPAQDGIETVERVVDAPLPPAKEQKREPRQRNNKRTNNRNDSNKEQVDRKENSSEIDITIPKKQPTKRPDSIEVEVDGAKRKRKIRNGRRRVSEEEMQKYTNGNSSDQTTSTQEALNPTLSIEETVVVSNAIEHKEIVISPEVIDSDNTSSFKDTNGVSDVEKNDDQSNFKLILEEDNSSSSNNEETSAESNQKSE